MLRFKKPIAALLVVVGGVALAWSRVANSAPSSPSKPAPAVPIARTAEPAAETATTDLRSAIQTKTVRAEFRGNGREKLRVVLENLSGKPITIAVPAGHLFDCKTNSVVTVRTQNFALKKAETLNAEVATVAVASTNKIGEASYTLSPANVPRLDTLLSFVGEHPELQIGAIQTAALALIENLPVSAFAKFPRVGDDLPTKFDTTAFKVDVSDIIVALIALRDIGVPDAQLALTVDPQLKIEAMIDPLAHAFAMRYYAIAPEVEWEFWKAELLKGDVSTRHYALYGIARFYPDVALQMLPRWARETKTSPVFRLSAVQSLAETERPEAVSVLRQLEHEFGLQTEIGKAAHRAGDYLDDRLTKAQAKKVTVAFRASKDSSAF
ncbi:MAG: hypothetical protein M3O82_06315 [Verrucomicrobiota bacterium]|nr:hypothetical protein [Verrucomicrobiota bacterium]